MVSASTTPLPQSSDATTTVVVRVVVEVEVSAAAVEAVAAVAEAVVAEEEEVAEAAEAVVERVAALHRGVAPVVVSASSSSAVLRPPPPSSFVSGTLGVSEAEVLAPAPTFSVPETALFPDATEIPHWGDLSRAGVSVFDLDYDAILAAMYALSTSDEGDCYLCVPPDPGIQAAALGAGETAALGARAYAAPGAGESAPSGTTSAQVLHTFTLDSARVLLEMLRLGVRSLGALILGVTGQRVLSLGVLSLGVRSLGVLRLGVWSLGLCEWFAHRTRLRSRAAGAGDPAAGDARARSARVIAGAGGTGGAAAAGSGGARTRGTGAAGTGGVGGAGAGDPLEPGATESGGAGAGGSDTGGAGAGGAGAGGASGTGAGGTVRPRPYFAPLLLQVLGVPSSTCLTTPLLCPPPDQSQPPLPPASPLPPPSPCSEQTDSLTERREPASGPASPVRTGRRVPRPRPPPVPSTHAMVLRPSSFPLRVPLPALPESSLSEVPDPESYRARAASPSVARLLATVVTDPSFEFAAASALIAELLDFAAACHLDYATALVVESASASPASVGGECALGTDVLEDRQENFECLVKLICYSLCRL
ncbi:unnamed protein product [Closterium sp. NIES-53]